MRQELALQIYTYVTIRTHARIIYKHTWIFVFMYVYMQICQSASLPVGLSAKADLLHKKDRLK